MKLQYLAVVAMLATITNQNQPPPSAQQLFEAGQYDQTLASIAEMRSKGATGLPEGDYDLVVANLPYVREDEWNGLAPEIREYEPRDALVAGAGGLAEIRALVDGAPAGTLLALEHAPDQAEAVAALLEGGETREDLSMRARVTVGRVR